jgi:hypothetical protein
MSNINKEAAAKVPLALPGEAIHRGASGCVFEQLTREGAYLA